MLDTFLGWWIPNDEKWLLDSDMTPWSVTKIMVCNADFLKKKSFKMDCNWSVFLHLLKPISSWFECTCVKNVLKWTVIGQYFCAYWNQFQACHPLDWFECTCVDYQWGRLGQIIHWKCQTLNNHSACTVLYCCSH